MVDPSLNQRRRQRKEKAAIALLKGGCKRLPTAQDLGILSNIGALTVRGFIDSNNPNDVDFYRFIVSGDTPLDTFLDIDLANDLNSQEDLDTGLDSMLWFFDETGRLIAENDDNDFFDFDNPEPGSSPFGDSDSFIGSITLNPGTYFAAVSAFANEPNALFQGGLTFTDLSLSGSLIDGTTPDTSFDKANDNTSSSGRYQLQIRTQEEDVSIPESSPVAGLLILGALGVGVALKGKFTGNRQKSNHFE